MMIWRYTYYRYVYCWAVTFLLAFSHDFLQLLPITDIAFHMISISFCPSLITKELDFWGLSEDILAVCCWDRVQEAKENEETLLQVNPILVLFPLIRLRNPHPGQKLVLSTITHHDCQLL